MIVGELQIAAGTKLDLAIDFAPYLDSIGATLSSAVWATISGLTNLGDSVAGSVARVRYTSVNVGAVYLPNVAASLSTGDVSIMAIRLEIVQRIVHGDLVTLIIGATTTLAANDWSNALDGDTIANRSWASSGAGLTITSGGTTATPKVTAVAAGTWYATEHIVMTSGQEDERSRPIVVRGLT